MRFTPLAAAALTAVLAAAPAPAQAKTVRGELHALLEAGQIDQATHDAYRLTYDASRKTLRRLRGARAVALKAVLRNTDEIAERGRLNATRAPAVFETLRRNRDHWSTGPLLRNGQRLSFPGSELVWQHYAGQGLQIQWLGTFGKANGLFAIRKDEQLRRLLDEALRFGAGRAGGIGFEYLFRFDGGRPPWVSGLAQGTGIQALSRAAARFGEPRYFEAARSALGIFRTAPPEGVRVDTPEGAHYLIYSFWKDLRVLNGFVQALNGLWDFAKFANDAEGRALFEAGERRLRAELPRYDTGAWSRYSNKRDSDLGYHKLVRDFLRNLCARLETSGASPAPEGGGTPPAPEPVVPDATPYCETAERFTGYLRTPPALEVVTESLREGRMGALRFRLSKPATVGITVRRKGKVVLARRLRLDSGLRSIAVKPSQAGPLAVALQAVDLAGNRGGVSGEVSVRPRAKR